MKENLSFETSQTLRLDDYLRRELPQCKSLGGKALSNSKIRRLIVAGAVFVNGRVVVRPAFELRGKSNVTVALDTERFFFEKQPDDIQFEVTDEAVLYEDENLIFINKPAFFPVEQTITGFRANLHDAVVDYLWKRNPGLRNPPYVGIMHRLDRTTSGVILFTKNRGVNKEISELFQSHAFTKQYYAVVLEKEGLQESFTVEMNMTRISSKSQAAKWGRTVPSDKAALYSKTSFKVLKKLEIEGYRCLLLECTLFTGRTHQIRVHLSSVGLPLLGDELYGGVPASRIYLHSARLSCDSFDVVSPCPWI